MGEAFVDSLFVWAARVWRPLLTKPIFVGVAGSAGKTTTKELLVHIVSRSMRGAGNPSSLNVLPEVAKTVLRVSPGQNFCVAELSEHEPGSMDAPLKLFRPSIGVVTIIGNDHWSAFPSREGIAEEVGKLVATLPQSGTAVINADDPLLYPMAGKCRSGVLRYGLSEYADLRAENVVSSWPDRLSMTLVYRDERVSLQTQLCGKHWASSVLAAVGAGISMGMRLQECAEAVSSFPPYEGRMQPVTTNAGITFIRDDWKAPLWTVESCLEFMGDASARRKIVVIGTLSDCGAGATRKYSRVAKRAQAVADLTIFVGPWASHVLKARQVGSEGALQIFRNVRDASEFLQANTQSGDLILLKGTNKQDHLIRMIMAGEGGIACWRDDCGRHALCVECPDRAKPSGLPLLTAEYDDSESVQDEFTYEPFRVGKGERVVIGLGNPELKYVGTPHNVGYEVADQLCLATGASWEDMPLCQIARGPLDNGQTLHILKLKTAMNLSGGRLKKLSRYLQFEPEQCILIFDDLDTKLGTTRFRNGGGAGGHRGVASILEAFQTNRFPRVKIGVGQAEAKDDRIKYVLTPFSETARLEIDNAIVAARGRVMELLNPGAAGQNLH